MGQNCGFDDPERFGVDLWRATRRGVSAEGGQVFTLLNFPKGTLFNRVNPQLFERKKPSLRGRSFSEDS
jgi:hypothetical protein